MPGTPIKIDDRTIGPSCPVFVIAETGSNHNGDLGMALALIDAAAQAGADADEFQTVDAFKIASYELTHEPVAQVIH